LFTVIGSVINQQRTSPPSPTSIRPTTHILPRLVFYFSFAPLDVEEAYFVEDYKLVANIRKTSHDVHNFHS